MTPVLNINEDEKTILLTALIHERVRLMKERTKRAEDCESSAFSREYDCAEIDAHADDVTDLRRKIEVAADITKAAWHNQYGWLHSKKVDEAVKADVEAVYQTRKEVAEAMGYDLEEINAANSRNRLRLKLNGAGF